jgi:hypothetical protein
MRRTLLLTVSCFAVAVPARAQDAPALAPGARVRITVPSRNLEKQIGTMHAIAGDALVVELLGSSGDLATPGVAAHIPLDSVTRLDVSAGRHRQTWRGAGIGFLVGAGAGLVVGPLSMECPSYGCDTSPGVAAAFGGIVLGGLGAVVGLVAGAATTSEKWEEVPVSALRASPAAGR